MLSQHASPHQKMLSGFLATVLVVAGLIAGMRFTLSDAVSDSPIMTFVDNNTYGDIDISGEWVGTTSEQYGDEARYDYRVVFVQDGDSINGILYLNRNHENAIYTETSFQGNIDGNHVFYSSQEILVIENAERNQLCLVDTTVQYEEVDGQAMLVGTWQGQANQQRGCDIISGQVLLTRQAE